MAKKEETGTTPVESPAINQQPQARPCPQDCRMCGINQQVFCTTKMLFDLSRRQQALESTVAEIVKSLADIQAQKKEEATEFSIPITKE